MNYKGVPLGTGYRADFIVEQTVLVELKSVEALLINFNAPTLRDGLRSFLNSV